VKIYPNEFFGYQRITVEQPMKKENGEVILNKKGKPMSDTNLRDYENIPFLKKQKDGKLVPQTIEGYFAREVVPHLPDLPAQKPNAGEYCIYVLKCADNSFYKGQTNNFPKKNKRT